MLALGGVMLALALGTGSHRLITLLRRTRWIFVSILIIYAYAMPGEPWFSQLGVLSPSYDGLVDGLTQLMRLITVLAGLAIVLTILSALQLIAGLYTLMYPMRYLGVSRERIAVRLALTLRYAESAMMDSTKDGLSCLDELITAKQTEAGNIELQLEAFGWFDWFLLFALGAIVLGILL